MNKITNVKRLNDVHLTMDQFEIDLEICLTIKKYPNKKRRYYVCDHFSAGLVKSEVRIFILS